MEASQITIDGKTFDLNHLNKTKKTNLRRKLIIEFIQSKPAGEYLTLAQMQQVGKFTTTANTHAFVKRMIRDGIISKHNGESLKSHYYAVTGSIRTKKTAPTEGVENPPQPRNPNIGQFIADMNTLGVKFTITINNDERVA